MRPVLILQTNLLEDHPSTIICPITTNVAPESDILWVHIRKGAANIKSDSDTMIDQIRAIDIRRLTTKVGELPYDLKLKEKKTLRLFSTLTFKLYPC